MMILLFIALLFLPSPSKSTNLLDEILNKHADAIGGKENWRNVKTLIVRLDTGEGGVMEAFTKKPDKFKLIMRFAGYVWEKGWNGEEGYVIYNGEDKGMTEGEAREMAEEPDFFDELVFAREKGYDVQLLTKEKLEGISVYKIKVTKAPDDEVTYYLNTTTYLIERIDETSHDPRWKGITFSTILQDYSEWGGLMIPTRWCIIGGFEKPRWMNVEEVMVNTPIKDEIFEKQ